MFGQRYIVECIVKIAASILCGCILGIERKTRNQVVGMRTLVLISVSSTLLAILSSYMSNFEGLNGVAGGGDPTRIAAGVVSGIGFLGGGAIMRQGLNIKGLTSAAIIWTAASLGLAIGSGLYIQSAVVLICVVVLLFALEKLEEKIFPASRSKTLHLVYEGEEVDVVKIKECIEKSGFVVSDLNLTRIIDEKKIWLKYSVKAPPEETYGTLISELKELGALKEFSISD